MIQHVALLTDFGLEDAYVAAVKSVILQQHPATSFIDISHRVAPQHIHQAAVILESIYPYLPDNTITLAIVDPGVGTQRPILALQHKSKVCLAPDNGILTPLLNQYQASNTYLMQSGITHEAEISRTFHGRDVFAPLACNWIDKKSEVLVNVFASPKVITGYEAVVTPDAVKGRIVFADHFGNLITNIRATEISGGISFWLEGERLRIIDTYADAFDGELSALINSMGRYEVAVKNGNAARKLDYSPDKFYEAELRVAC